MRGGLPLLLVGYGRPSPDIFQICPRECISSHSEDQLFISYILNFQLDLIFKLLITFIFTLDVNGTCTGGLFNLSVAFPCHSLGA